MKETGNNEASMSLSKQRKLQREKEIKKMKKEAFVGKLAGYIVLLVIAAGIITLVGFGINRILTKVTADNNYSAQISDGGFIKDATATDYVELCDYDGITIPYSEVAFTDEEIDKEIQTLLESFDTLSTTTTEAIVDGDSVNIDYVGRIDGVEFEGGNTNNSGADLTIGSDSYIDGFEDQLIGHKVGETFDINVTFPDPYQNNPDLAGKDAVFTVIVNGIYETPEFTDEFVEEKLAAYATTVEGYRTYVRDLKEKSNITTWIQEYLVKNASVDSYPKAYLNQLKSILKYEDIAYYESMNEYFNSSYGYYPYESFESYTQMTEAAYDRSLIERAETLAGEILIYQAIAEKEGITSSESELKEYMLANGETEESLATYLETYGLPYMLQQHIAIEVVDFIKTNATIQ